MERNIEICDHCEIYETSKALIMRMFGSDEFEIKDIDDFSFNCEGCGRVIYRYDGFMKSFNLLRDMDYVNDVVNYFDDGLKGIVREIMNRLKIPSFAADITDLNVPKSDISSIENSGLFSFVISSGSVPIVLAVADAERIELFENSVILDSIGSYRVTHLERGAGSSARKHSMRRLERIRALPDDLTDADKLAITERFGGKCALTGRELPLQLDHVLPVAIGHGGTTKANMLPIWQRINSSKGARNLFEWYADNGERFGVIPELFDQAVAYLAELNGMTADEYRDYVYDCHANPNDTLTEVCR